jgi:glycosyltransferase involved in cell wall biosynthesis
LTSIVLLARHYPPAVSGGARRPRLLVEELRKLGVRVFVVAPSLPQGESGELGIEVPHPNRDPPTSTGYEKRRSIRDHLRELLLWPDPEIRWCMRAAKAAIGALPFKPDWVFTTSPPESIHVAGALLKWRTGARWVADFRDTWLDRPHRLERLSPVRRVGETAVARIVLPRADVTLAVDPVVGKDASGLGARNVNVLAHFSPNSLPAPAILPEDRLNVVSAGNFELSDPLCRIENLLDAFSAARVRNERLLLHLLGRLSAREQSAARATFGTIVHGPKSYDESLAYIGGADALVIVASRKMHVPPSKIVEYLLTDKPIIACGEGPWRNDPRTPRGDCVEMLSGLTKGAARMEKLPRSLRASEAARVLIDILTDFERSTRSRSASYVY